MPHLLLWDFVYLGSDKQLLCGGGGGGGGTFLSGETSHLEASC